jgi:hypothetical protein
VNTPPEILLSDPGILGCNIGQSDRREGTADIHIACLASRFAKDGTTNKEYVERRTVQMLRTGRLMSPKI